MLRNLLQPTAVRACVGTSPVSLTEKSMVPSCTDERELAF